MRKIGMGKLIEKPVVTTLVAAAIALERKGLKAAPTGLFGDKRGKVESSFTIQDLKAEIVNASGGDQDKVKEAEKHMLETWHGPSRDVSGMDIEITFSGAPALVLHDLLEKSIRCQGFLGHAVQADRSRQSQAVGFVVR